MKNYFYFFLNFLKRNYFFFLPYLLSIVKVTYSSSAISIEYSRIYEIDYNSRTLEVPTYLI
jgi:hypothetical protein